MLTALAFALLQQGGGRDLQSGGYAEIESPDALLQVGPWRAWLDSPGGELPFALEIARDGKKLTATIGNGEEKIAVPETRLEGADIVFDIPHYDSRITAKIAPLGTKLDGEWKKRSGTDRWTTLKFHATAGAAPRFTALPEGTIHSIEGRWSVHFDKGNEDGVLILRKGPETTIEGTFLMPTGDYRWLAGSIQGHRVRLSCFDGAHAFLFDANIGFEEWMGKFWSGDRWEDSWSAVFNTNAMLKDGFDQAHWMEGFGLAELLYPDLNGNEHSLGEEAFAGKAIVIQILGSWCPNCHDETAYLARVYDRYKERGLSVVGLAFELTGDFARDSEQARRMRERHKAAYPFLLAGLSDKKKAAEAFPALDQVFAFPTTIFLHRDGRVRAVHSGFSGPGTKEEHEKLAKKFEGIIEDLLAEPEPSKDHTWTTLKSTAWVNVARGDTLEFRLDMDEQEVCRTFDGSDPLLAESLDCGLFLDPPHLVETEPVVLRGSVVLMHGVAWQLDSAARIIRNPRNLSECLQPSEGVERLRPYVEEREIRKSKQLVGLRLWPSIDGRTAQGPEDLVKLLGSSDPAVRRQALECACQLVELGWPGVAVDPTALLSDPDVLVRTTAAWAAGRLRIQGSGPALLGCVHHGFSSLRREAARAIGEVGYAPGSDALAALEADPDPLVREAAEKALQKLRAR